MELYDFISANRENNYVSLDQFKWFKTYCYKYLDDEEKNKIYTELWDNQWTQLGFFLIETNEQDKLHYLLSAYYYKNYHAITYLGYYYLSGTFIPKDLTKAKELFESSKTYDPYAYNGLGLLYEIGLNETFVRVKHTKLEKGKNFILAKECYIEGDKLGCEDCTFQLANLYYRGKGMRAPKISMARELFKKYDTPKNNFYLAMSYSIHDGYYHPHKKTSTSEFDKYFGLALEGKYPDAILLEKKLAVNEKMLDISKRWNKAGCPVGFFI
jgi:hypothetical protein